MSSVDVQVRTVQYCVDMIQTFALADRAILKINILSYADASLSCDAYVFIPISGHLMWSSIATPYADICKSLHSTVTIGIDRYDRITVPHLPFLCLEDTVSDTTWVLKAIFSPEVSQRFVLPEWAALESSSAINRLQRPYLLVHRYAKKWHETEIDCLKIFRVDFLELFLSLLILFL